jgi:hypothetical protein
MTRRAYAISRIFEVYASGIGIVRIAKRFNEERVLSPRGDGWAPTALREMLYRDLYRGVIVWERLSASAGAGRGRSEHAPSPSGLRSMLLR